MSLRCATPLNPGRPVTGRSVPRAASPSEEVYDDVSDEAVQGQPVVKRATPKTALRDCLRAAYFVAFFLFPLRRRWTASRTAGATAFT